MLDELDKKIIAALQDDFPLVAEPYRELGKRIGISEETLLNRLKEFRERGELRRMGAVLRHREIGYVANALCAWKVADERVEEVAFLMSEYPAVTHCYERVTYPDWPYNLYIMLHGRSRDECREMAGRLAETTGLTEYLMLFSTHEWKKASMRYFAGKSDQD